MKRKTFVEVFEDVLKVAHDPLILESVLTEKMQAILQVSIVAQKAPVLFVSLALHGRQMEGCQPFCGFQFWEASSTGACSFGCSLCKHD